MTSHEASHEVVAIFQLGSTNGLPIDSAPETNVLLVPPMPAAGLEMPSPLDGDDILLVLQSNLDRHRGAARLQCTGVQRPLEELVIGDGVLVVITSALVRASDKVQRVTAIQTQHQRFE